MSLAEIMVMDREDVEMSLAYAEGAGLAHWVAAHPRTTQRRPGETPVPRRGRR